jgi:hypothetical protein
VNKRRYVIEGDQLARTRLLLAFGAVSALQRKPRPLIIHRGGDPELLRPATLPVTQVWRAAAVPASSRRYGRAARLMRPCRAAQPPAAPAGSAWSIIGAVARRGEDPPHDGGVIAADIVRRAMIIQPPGIHARPARRSSFGGLAFNDPHDVEGSHVRHDPPSPWARSGREPPSPASAPRARILRPGAAAGAGSDNPATINGPETECPAR